MLDRRVVRVAILEDAEAEPLHRATFDLSLHERRVDRLAHVVALPEARHRDNSGLLVDLDLCCARGVGDGRVGRQIDLARLGLDDRGERLQLCAGPGEQLAIAPGRCRGHVGNADLLLRRTLRDHFTVDDLEVGRVDLELLAGDLEDLLTDVLGRLLDGLAGNERCARGERAGADGRRVGVRIVVGDPLVGHADRLRHDLRLDRLRAVADVGRSREHVDAAVRLDLDPRLRRVAVLVHPRRVLDCREAAAGLDCHGRLLAHVGSCVVGEMAEPLPGTDTQSACLGGRQA